MIGEVFVSDHMVQRAFDRAPGVMRRVMDRYVGRAGLELARAVRKELRENESMGESTLLNSIRADRPFPLVRDVRAGVKYARAVEDGTRPGYMPPVYPLAAWLKAKEGLDDKDAKRRAMGLACHIRDHGTEAHPFVKPAYRKTHSRLLQILRDGAAEGVREALGVRNHYAMTGSRG